ncbi:flagellar basal body rod protein FlgB [Glaciecola sp. 1036]|uniref:flagellar basal body rod protein FlgB n=1 Tax=Alteromonadaceae TaxID=72275 RepID=UPI003D038DB4
MAISLDKMVGFHHKALQIRADKMEVIAGNLANANTPGYKARDINFQQAMAKANYGQSGMVTTHHNHIEGGKASQFDVQFRIPTQPDTGDGNTVDVQEERNNFLETGMRYEAGLTLLSGKFSGMKKALSGGGQG